MKTANDFIKVCEKASIQEWWDANPFSYRNVILSKCNVDPKDYISLPWDKLPQDIKDKVAVEYDKE